MWSGYVTLRRSSIMLGTRIPKAGHIVQVGMQSTVLLNDGNRMPVLGLGTWTDNGKAVSLAINHGYKLFDTATLYGNEEEIGRSIKSSGVPRDELFIVTKLWNTDHGRENTVRSFTESLQRLGLDYVDLYLMHSPMGGKTVETWNTIASLKQQGLAKSIGVANFNADHLKHLKEACPEHIPAVNQIEIHPFVWWEECVSYCRQQDITVMAYSPLAQARKLNNSTLISMAKRYGRSPAQVMIRWSLQHEFIPIPKSSREKRIVENSNVFDFQISPEDMQTLDGLDKHFISDWPGVMDHPWEP